MMNALKDYASRNDICWTDILNTLEERLSPSVKRGQTSFRFRLPRDATIEGSVPVGWTIDLIERLQSLGFVATVGIYGWEYVVDANLPEGQKMSPTEINDCRDCFGIMKLSALKAAP